MADTIQLTQTHYMKIDDQWTIVHPGSTVVVPSAAAFPNSVTTSAGTGTLTANNTPKFVSGRKGF